MEGLIYTSRYFRVIATGLIFLINITSSFAGCADTTIGVENKYIIPDSSFTASSVNNEKYVPSSGRLEVGYGWGPSKLKLNDPHQYLQIDLGLPYFICALATQGCRDKSEWVTQYNISLSMDNTNWTLYQENGTTKMFAGNTDSSTIKKNTLTQPLARYIRFIPKKYHVHKTMRVGIYGYVEACENVPLGMGSEAIQDGNITASSAQHPAKNARLYYTSGPSWCATTSDSDPYLQIDFGTSHLICAVATQGNSIADKWVKTYKLDTSTDGTTWTTYQENNIDRIFYGNFNRTTVVRQILYHGIVTRFLRILPKTYQTSTPCLRTEIYGYPSQTACSSHSVGIPSTVLVPDHRFTATSVFLNEYSPHKGRLGATSAWLASTNTADDHLQIDLGAVFYICAVATQGTGKTVHVQYVKKYKVTYSTNNKHSDWTRYSDDSGVEELEGNTDSSTVFTNTLTSPFRAKFVRVIPTDYEQYKTLRVDLKGLPLGCTSSLGLENLLIPDAKITSSSHWKTYVAPRGRLYGSSSWCSPTPNSTEYIQVDLGQVKTVTGIATQGSVPVNVWVTSYKVSYSFDNTYWNEYKEEQVVKNLEGNTNRNDVRVNWLRHPIAARYIRIIPQTHNSGGRHCLRFDLYGCDVFAVPKVILDTADLILPSIKGSSRTLTCSVLGEPTPDIQWFNNGTKINGATQSTLQVQFISAEDVVSKYNCARQDPNTRPVVCNTFYTCRATYPSYVPSGGMDEASVKVTVNLNVSEAPRVTATPPNKRSITLSWTAMAASDDAGIITSYAIQLHNQSGSIITHNADHPTFNYTVKQLKPYANYSIRMNAISAVGQGLWSSWLNVTTLIAEPQGIPSILGTTVLSSQSIRVHFQYSQFVLLHGPMAGFRIFYKSEGGSQQHIDVGNVKNATLKNLTKYTEYSISVAVRNTLYVGPASSVTVKKTSEDVPDIGPQNTTAKKINDTTFLVTWQPLTTAESNGVVTKYEIFWSLVVTGRRSRRSSQKMFNATTQATQYTLYNLRVCANYIVSVGGYTSVGPGPKSTISILTSRAQPGKPTDVQVEGQTKTSIEVRWEKPSVPPSLVVFKYTIDVKGSKSYWPLYSFSKTYTQDGAQTNMVIDGLVPGTSYEFWVMATAACGKSEKSASSRRDTDIDKPVKPEGKSVTLTDKFNVSLWSVDPINGPISSYQVIVIKGNKNASNLPTNISDHKDGKDPYITAELKPNEFKSSFPVGDNKKYGKYKNVQLDKGETYTIAERAITEHQGKVYAGQAAVVATIKVTQEQKGGRTGSPAGPIAGAVIAVLLILAMVVLIVLIKRRRQKRDSGKESRVPLDDMGDTQSGNVNNAQDNEEVQNDVTISTAGASVPSQDDIYEEAIADNTAKPIPVRQFAEYLKSTKATDYVRLKKEYKKLQNTRFFPQKIAKKPVNKTKNRYGNAIPYDHSRVIIEQTDADEDSDYINASYLTGFDGTKRKYIATQGPVEQTFADFWQMIWEQNTGTIVMLTNLKELGKTKCHQYWPESSETYRDMTVNIHKTEVFPDYIIRTLLLKKTNSEEQRCVIHFQFTVWPDKGVPHYATAVLAFRRKVKSMNPPNSGPIVIHCSAGIGRTGCYIVIDAMLERAKKLRNVDIANYVSDIRKDRTSMVQTDEQYVFIHLAILESLTCGNTEIQAINLQATMHKLLTVNLQKNATGYALEFKRLNVVTADYAQDECDVGRSNENAVKNRYPNVIALNHSRVKLMREDIDTNKTDYINASFADAYRERNAFIMTQAPLQNTIEDFWIMVVNYDIRTIVMLNTLEEENEQFPQYWPHEGSHEYGAVTVQLQDTRDVGASQNVVARSLQVTYKSSSVRVQHLQHLKWANKSIPDKPQTVLELLNEVQQSQRQTNNATPFVVQCSNGVGRSGTLCAISSILERMKQEQVIDVFQVVKCMRSNRPGVVESLTQYSFCYHIIQKYLDSFSDYANFSDC